MTNRREDRPGWFVGGKQQRVIEEQREVIATLCGRVERLESGLAG